MRFAIFICSESTTALHTCTPQIISDNLPFNPSSWFSLRKDVVENAKRPPKPQANIDGLDNALRSVIEDCWSQGPSNRPTANTVSLRLHDVNCDGCPVNPAFVPQPHTLPKQVQDRNISINEEDSTTGRAGGIKTRNQPNVVSPFVKPPSQNVKNSLETSLNDSITTRCVPITGEKSSS